MATPGETHCDVTNGWASRLTPAGRGAVAVVAAEGAAAMATVDAHFRAANRLPLREQPLNRIAFGHWTAGGDHREEVVVCRTDDSRVEVHCHGGIAAAERILAALAEGGCRIEPWSDWLGADAACALDAEADVALAGATTRRTAEILLDQRHGALRTEIESAQIELATRTSDGIAAARRRISALLDRAAIGLHLTHPWQVAIAGRPNVGKSSLINALAGYQRAIVFDQPGTTRDVLAAETAVNGWPVRLTDAAGLRAAVDPLESAGVDLAKEQLARADLVVWVLDAAALMPAELTDPAATARREMANEVGELSSTPPLVVVNKTDLIDCAPPSGCVNTSALMGAGLDVLLAGIAQRLVPRAPAAGVGVPFTRRQVELLRAAGEHAAAGETAVASGELGRLVRGHAR